MSSHIRSVYWLPEYGYEVLLLGYRGYGTSEGDPCIEGIFNDVQAGYEWLQLTNEEQLPIFILGQSLGASIAAYSAAENTEWQLAGVILDAPFSSYREIVRDKLSTSWLTWPFQYPLSWMFTDQYSPYQNVESISPVPLLMFSSTSDRVVPSAHSAKLFQMAGQPKQVVTTSGTHIATFSKETHRHRLLKFLDSHRNNLTRQSNPRENLNTDQSMRPKTNQTPFNLSKICTPDFSQ